VNTENEYDVIPTEFIEKYFKESFLQDPWGDFKEK
jgi:hypothetical protein